ncbi:hypothetical protein WN943_015717 [Citrus x changshan-huyou]
MPRGKHYVVFLGRVPGIYGSWSECQRQVIGFPRNSYQSYPTRAEAEEAFQAFHRAQGAICVTGVEQEAKRGNLSGAFKGQMEEATTSVKQVHFPNLPTGNRRLCLGNEDSLRGSLNVGIS